MSTDEKNAPAPVAQGETVARADWVNSVMEEVQHFASAWALVGTRFDNGCGLEDAEQIKAALRSMLAAAPAPVAQPTLPAAVPLTWEIQAVAWLRGKAAEQAQNNERWPQHAACYPSWIERVKHAQRLADELEREAAISNANHATGLEGGAALAAHAPVARGGCERPYELRRATKKGGAAWPGPKSRRTMSKPEIPANHWAPVGVGDQWSIRCLSTGEFLANGKTPNEPWLVPKVSIALTLCTNCESGNYDNAPPDDVWFVVSDGNGKTRGDRRKHGTRQLAATTGDEAVYDAIAAGYRVTVPEAWNAPAPVAQVDHNLLEWAVSRWRDEVQHRPIVNKNRRPLDDSWRQVIRFAGGDPVAILGPSHDELVQANPQAFRAPAPAPVAQCACKDRPADQCPGEWEPGCDMGANELHAAPAPTPVARLTLPEGWVPLTSEWEPGYPEDVAYGPQRMMDRLKKWLDKHFAARIAESAAPAPVAQPEPVYIRADDLAKARIAPQLCRVEPAMREGGFVAVYQGAPSPVAPTPATADDLREPKNGAMWRVEWWNETMRMMLPNSHTLQGCTRYKNGTLVLTIRRGQEGGAA